MGLTKLESKVVANAQKRNFSLIEGELNEAVAGSLHKKIYHPESSEIIGKVMAGMVSGVWRKESFIGSDALIKTNSINVLMQISERVERLLCLFPNASSRLGDYVSDLPVLEIDAAFSADWYEVANKNTLHFYFCVSVNFDMGLILDVYEADPLVHKASGPITDLYTWG